MRGQRKNPRKAVQPFENKKRKIDIFKNYEANGVEKIQRKLEIFSTLISKKSSVFNEIRARGCSDILIAVTDGLKGMTKAIETVYPKTMHQTCIVHLLRNSTAFVSYKDLKQVMKELKGIYGADNAEEAKNRLEL